MALLTGFHHIAIKCQDFDRSVVFYRTLGFSSVLQWGEGNGRACMLSLGGVCVELFAGGGEAPEGKWIHLALATADCNAAYAAALSAGAVTYAAPKDTDIPDKNGAYPVRIGFVKGPDGEMLEFFQTR